MKTKLCFCAALVLASAWLGAAEPKGAKSHVVVNFDHPEKFTDVKDSSIATENGRDGYLQLIKEYLESRAPRYLAEGQTLTLTFTDIDMAGDFEPWRGPNFMDVRIVKDIYPPRLTFSYKVTDASGAVVKEGQEKLIDLAFQMRASPIDNQDALRYEKGMLDDWMRDQFRRPKKTAKTS